MGISFYKKQPGESPGIFLLTIPIRYGTIIIERKINFYDRKQNKTLLHGSHTSK